MGFQRALERASRRNPAWRHATVYGQATDGIFFNPGGHRYNAVKETRAVLDYRPSEESSAISTRRYSHRLLVVAESWPPTWDFVRVGDLWLSIQRWIAADAQGATMTFDCSVAEGLGPA